MTMLNFAHRGARSLAPENTMPAIRKAWEIGTHGIEVDVGVSRDGELILIHDSRLGRTTNVAERFPDRVDQPFTAFTYPELQQLDAGSWFLDRDPFAQIRAGLVSFADMEAMHDTRIPRLKEVLDFARHKKWRLNLELKTMAPPMHRFPLAEAVVELLDREGIAEEAIIISSFDHENLRIVQRLRPNLEVNALIGAAPDRGNDWGRFEFGIYNANAAWIDESQVRRAREHGCTVNLYTVNRPEEMRRFRNWGVAALITDFPQLLAGLVD